MSDNPISPKKITLFQSLYWKISLLFLGLMLVVGATYVYITSSSINEFYLETKQLLCKDVAHQVIDDVDLFKGDTLNEQGIKHVMMHHMQVNPSAEVYVLDTLGRVLTYDAPPEKIKLKAVGLDPIKKFIAAQGQAHLVSEDPRNPGVDKIFSAAPIVEDHQLKGYVYVILSSEEYQTAADLLYSGFIFKVGKQTLLLTFTVAILFGLLAIWYLTKNLKKIEQGVERFQQEDFSQEIKLETGGEFGQLADTLNHMAATIDCNIRSLKSMENLRKELVANVSHDLRTPLAIIHGYAETLVIKGKELSDTDREKYLNNILRSTENLERLVGELFELSKLESNKVKLSKEKVNLSELLNDIVGRYQLLASKKEIELKLKVDMNAQSVLIDIALMERAIQNLLENALKFTPEGGVVTLRITGQNNFLRVEIQDSGVGIEEEYLPFVFDRYKKISKDLQNNPGAGLGLAIVKKILQLHGIDITVQSEKNKGTAFSFQIPVV